MAIESYDGILPVIPSSAYVAASADLIGRVTLGEESSIWYHAVLRGDINSITVGPRSNIQDNVVVHLADDYGCHLGELVTVGHSAVIHACTIKDEVLIGMGAVVLDGAVIGERSIIGAGALVTGGTIISPGSLVIGSPAKVVRTLSLDEQAKVKTWAEKYVMVSRRVPGAVNPGSPRNAGACRGRHGDQGSSPSDRRCALCSSFRGSFIVSKNRVNSSAWYIIANKYAAPAVRTASCCADPSGNE